MKNAERLAAVEQLSNACPSGGGSACVSCRAMCGSGYPGRFTPSEARAAIDAGHGDRLIAVSHGGTTHIRPAIVGWEESDVEEFRLVPGQCNFLSATGHCEIHASGFKPIECRTAACETSGRTVTRGDITRMVAAIDTLWRSKAGRAVVAKWRAEHP